MKENIKLNTSNNVKAYNYLHELYGTLKDKDKLKRNN